MGRFLKQDDKECMKMAMLKHEETFRQQVHELHRLYRVQKLLMRDMNMEPKRQRKPSYSQNSLNGWNLGNETGSNQGCYSYRDQRSPRQTLNLELPAEEYIENNDRHGMLENECETDLELTLATGGSQRKREETPYTSDSGASFSSSSAESGVVKLNGDGWGLFQVSEAAMSFRSERKSGFDVEEQLRQDRIEQPPWLFQCLSLNMT